MTMLEAAMEYLALKLPVFPVRPDKTPLTPHGLKDATMLQIRAKEYWEKWPEAGIGVVTDGLIVLDFDAAHGGFDSLNQMIEKYGKFPDTRVHQTGGGGLHFIFRNTNGKDHRNTTNFAGYQGVDIRANGGYIVAPPSPHLSGNCYEVLDNHEIAPCPEWLAELLSHRGKPVPLSEFTEAVVIAEGRRNASLASLAGAMRRQGCSQAIIEKTLLETNTQQCNPPLPEKDVLRIAKSISRYEPNLEKDSYSNNDSIDTFLINGSKGDKFLSPFEANSPQDGDKMGTT